ncbi:MAG TPA: phenylacetate--CoA ligase family protein [Candidatus Korarchaeota archaeon]|nr:phenylacetate--CoA ligase family protein [Candidatus Korarchaeota archaeon]
MKQRLFALGVSLFRRNPGLKERARPLFRRLIDRHANSRVRWTVRRVYSKSRFYRDLMRRSGLAHRDIRGVEDLGKLPLTSPSDLSADPYAFLCVPFDEVGAVYTTAGTTGDPKMVFFTRDEIDRAIELGGTMMRAGGLGPGFGPGKPVQIMFAYGRPSWGAGYVSQRMVERAGGLPIPASNSLEPEEQLSLMEKFRPVAILGTTSYVFRVTEELVQRGVDLRQFGVHTIALGAEAWPESVREYLEEKWGATVVDQYGLTEATFAVAAECREQDGLHVNEIDLYVEIVDPETGERVAPGEEGEIVFTTLSRRAMPLVRYRTGDVAAMIPGECGCGSPTVRITRIRGRTDDMFTLGTGENMYPSFFDEALLGIPGVVDYQIVLSGENMRDSILVRVEASSPSEDLRREIREAVLGVRSIRHDFEVSKAISSVEVEFVGSGEISQASGEEIKRRRVVDLRGRYPT